MRCEAKLDGQHEWQMRACCVCCGMVQECEQLRALLRRLRDEPLMTSSTPYADGVNDGLRNIRYLIDESGLLGRDLTTRQASG